MNVSISDTQSVNKKVKSTVSKQKSEKSVSVYTLIIFVLNSVFV